MYCTPFRVRSKCHKRMIQQNMHLLWSTCIGSLLGSIGSTLLAEHFLNHRIAIVGSFIGLQPSTNKGVAFGLELGLAEPLLIAIAAVTVTVMATKTARTSLSRLGFGLILGGGAANILDRIQDGQVTDIFQIGSFPIFNVADSCITIGVGLLLIEMLYTQRKDKRF